jgi:hypothetical protein
VIPLRLKAQVAACATAQIAGAMLTVTDTWAAWPAVFVGVGGTIGLIRAVEKVYDQGWDDGHAARARYWTGLR